MGVMNELINPRVVRSLERNLAAASPGSSFPHLAATAGQLEELSLRERTDLLSRALLEDSGKDREEQHGANNREADRYPVQVRPVLLAHVAFLHHELVVEDPPPAR